MPPVGRPRSTTNIGERAPTSELGHAYPLGGSVSGYNPLTGRPAPWKDFVEPYELVPELMWPNSVRTYDQMRTDAQISGLFSAVMYGIGQLRFVLDPNEARPEIVQDLAVDLNVPIMGEEQQPKQRLKNRFAHQKHVYQTLLALLYGHMYFEQIGRIVDGKWRLRKLAPRMPQTISRITVADDGGLVAIYQGNNGVLNNDNGIPVDRLVGFIFQQEGFSWVGRSMLRDLYREWLIKDRLMRIDAINHERAGGVPFGIGSPEMTPSELDAFHQQMQLFKIGDTSGGAVPYGAEIQIAKGTGSDVMASIQAHNEAMARRFLLMVASLAQGGSHVGSYSLGEVFQDFFVLGQRAIAQWYCDTMNEHVIEDWVDWNYENEELVPVLRWEGEDDVLGTDQLVQMVDSNIITMSEEDEDWIRYRKRLPKRTEPRPSPEELAAPAGDQGEAAPSPSASPAKSGGSDA